MNSKRERISRDAPNQHLRILPAGDRAVVRWFAKSALFYIVKAAIADVPHVQLAVEFVAFGLHA